MAAASARSERNTSAIPKSAKLVRVETGPIRLKDRKLEPIRNHRKRER